MVNEIKGYTVRVEKLSGYQRLYVSIKPPKEDVLSYEEYKELCFKNIDYHKFGVVLLEWEGNKLRSHLWTEVAKMPKERAEYLYEINAKRFYEIYNYDGICIDMETDEDLQKLDMFTERFRETLVKIRHIMFAFKHKDSKYCNNGFEEYIYIKPALK